MVGRDGGKIMRVGLVLEYVRRWGLKNSDRGDWSEFRFSFRLFSFDLPVNFGSVYREDRVVLRPLKRSTYGRVF